MKSGISRYTLGGFNQSALDDVYNKAKEIYISEVEPPASGVLPNSVDLIWDDLYGGNLNFTTATSTSLGQYNPDSIPGPPIGTEEYPVPTANMWLEVELEGIDTSCSRTIDPSSGLENPQGVENIATNTRVEIAPYKGWWLDAAGNWNPMTYNTRGGYQVPDPTGQTTGIRGCNDQYFVDQRALVEGTIRQTIISPDRPSSGRWPSQQHLTAKPENYYRWHGWADKTVYATPQTCKAVFFQIYMRLVVEDENLPDDRHLAKFVAHTGSDRKEYDGTQLWDMGISRFKRVNNDWTPFNFLTGPQTKAELEANPPPFDSVP